MNSYYVWLKFAKLWAKQHEDNDRREDGGA